MAGREARLICMGSPGLTPEGSMGDGELMDCGGKGSGLDEKVNNEGCGVVCR